MKRRTAARVSWTIVAVSFSLSGELLGVVRKTMQPTHAFLWLRETPR